MNNRRRFDLSDIPFFWVLFALYIVGVVFWGWPMFWGVGGCDTPHC